MKYVEPGMEIFEFEWDDVVKTSTVGSIGDATNTNEDIISGRDENWN